MCGPVKAVVVATMVALPARWPMLWHMMARAGGKGVVKCRGCISEG